MWCVERELIGTTGGLRDALVAGERDGRSGRPLMGGRLWTLPMMEQGGERVAVGGEAGQLLACLAEVHAAWGVGRRDPAQ